MASQIYSRYIPPPKKSPATILPTSKSPAAPLKTPIPVPTRKDASATYTRYVPPTKTKDAAPVPSAESSVVLTPSSKRCREELVEETSSKRTKWGKSEKKIKKTRGDSPRIPRGEKAVESVEIAGDSTLGPHSAESEEGHTSAKTKKDKKKKTSSQPTEGVNTSANPGSIDAVQNAIVVLDKRKNKKEKDVAMTEADVAGMEEDGRHKKLMEKRQRSLRKADKLAQKSILESEVVLEPEQPVEVHDLVPLPQPELIPEPAMVSTTSSLPPWLATPIRVLPTATASFSELGILDEVAKVLQKRGFNEAFAVQAAVLPLLLPGNQQPGDVLVSAATGSGKTLAYVLPMIEDISRSQTTKLRGLIVMPTRELVTQAKEICEICASAFPRKPKIGTAVGNETLKGEQEMLMDQELVYDPVAYRNQQERLDRKWDSSGSRDGMCDEEIVSELPDHVFCPVSKVDILICTPGRLVEHVKSTPGFTLDHMKWLVVDEADKLLDQSFQQWLDIVMAGVGPVKKVILSATMTRDIGLLNPLKLYRPKLVVLEGSETSTGERHVLPSLLVESSVKVDDGDIKPLYLMELLKRGGLLSAMDGSSAGSSADEASSEAEESSTPEPKSKTKGVLIFTKSNESALRLGRLIALLSPSSANQIGTLTSTTPRASRKSTIRAFPAKISILVASDLVSRGMDLPNLGHVINYDIPTSLTSYVHRIGRTARAGKKGHAWTLYTGTEGRWFWNEIGRGPVERSAKVERVTIEVGEWGYEDALEELGREAHGAGT